jgi:type I restriction enzyme S subunit
MSYDKWEKINLSQIVTSVSTSFNFNKDKLVLVNTSDVLEGKVLTHTFVKNEKIKGQFKKAFEKDDILYSEIRPKNKRFAYIDFNPEGYVASTKLMVLRGKSNKVDNKFLYQILTSTEMINKLQQIAESRSGTFPQITFTQLGEQEVNLPPIKEQKVIANILSSLDDKIELNNKINKNLEELAQTIYKRWFVDFEFPNEDGEPYKSSGGEMIESELGLIPKGWEVVQQGEFFPVVTGKKNANIATENGKYKFFTCSQQIYKTDDYSFEGDAILVAGNGDFNVKYYSGKFEAYQRTYVLIPKNTKLSGFLFTAIKYNLNNITMGSRGSVISFITKGHLEYYKLALPNDEILEKLGVIFKSTLIQIANNNTQNEKLSNLRDELLPKLMSGEIDVSHE